MTTINELVEATKRQKRLSDRCVGWPLAAIKAIESKGYRYTPEKMKRRVREILAALRAEGVIARRPHLR